RDRDRASRRDREAPRERHPLRLPLRPPALVRGRRAVHARPRVARRHRRPERPPAAPAALARARRARRRPGDRDRHARRAVAGAHLRTVATSALPRPVRRPAALSGVRLEALGIVAVTVGIGVFYRLIDAAFLNTPGYLDPWIYYALFQNFDYLYDAFGFT